MGQTLTLILSQSLLFPIHFYMRISLPCTGLDFDELTIDLFQNTDAGD